MSGIKVHTIDKNHMRVTGADDIDQVKRAIDYAVRERLPVDEGVGTWGVPCLGFISSAMVELTTRKLFDGDDEFVNGRDLKLGGETLYKTRFKVRPEEGGAFVIKRRSKGPMKNFVLGTTSFIDGIQDAFDRGYYLAELARTTDD